MVHVGHGAGCGDYPRGISIAAKTGERPLSIAHSETWSCEPVADTARDLEILNAESRKIDDDSCFGSNDAIVA